VSEILSWDKSIHKKMKSSDDKDLGKVQNITRDYIQTKEGTIGKNYYYIPKYYMQGYDGDHLWVSLTEDEVQSRFEGEKDPAASMFETPEYLERRTTITKEYPDFETDAMDKSKSLIFIKCDGKKEFLRALADVDN
jgi:hypothetical protein